MKQKIKIGYFADGPWSHIALKRILQDENFIISFICARYEHPDEILEAIAKENNIEFFSHPNINSNEFFQRITQYEFDIFVSLSFNQIFKKNLIELPKLKTINCHAGKLPYYRGRNVLNWALINDEKEFGITVHYIDDGIDTGDILEQIVYPITDEDDYQTLLQRAYVACSDVLYSCLQKIKTNNLNPIKQETISRYGIYCVSRKEGDEIIDWNQSSREVFNFIRSICYPGPQARCYLGEDEVKINKAIYLKDAPIYKGIPGSIIGKGFDYLYVKTGDSFIKITEWSGLMKIRIGDRFR
ncbi:methionyl-tRNA formyltransferase [Leptospira santarosai]|uniref:methionyl-tRNA formyltransferase n=1 Tax=Leptospira santarosai TaxID=28183 RepID=UPI0002C01B8A|nr:methionyl-tRNA formyltransferase [Leptospira santarosai]EMO24102.1 formyl transferase, C-terminal domain protein [Leptospira santarosai str. HAI134]MDI7166859.1 methionyl-tRNA formyltransferase [Leptospira santarosai]